MTRAIHTAVVISSETLYYKLRLSIHSTVRLLVLTNRAGRVRLRGPLAGTISWLARSLPAAIGTRSKVVFTVCLASEVVWCAIMVM